MILLDHTVPMIHEAESLLLNWEFIALAIGTISGLVTSYFKQTNTINILKVELKNMGVKYDARIDSLKEQVDRDRVSVQANHNKLYDLCTEMNQRIGEMQGALNKGK